MVLAPIVALGQPRYRWSFRLVPRLTADREVDRHPPDWDEDESQRAFDGLGDTTVRHEMPK
jgi:hypothetical protein